jgi:hypothetical protein
MIKRNAILSSSPVQKIWCPSQIAMLKVSSSIAPERKVSLPVFGTSRMPVMIIGK